MDLPLSLYSFIVSSFHYSFPFCVPSSVHVQISYFPFILVAFNLNRFFSQTLNCLTVHCWLWGIIDLSIDWYLARRMSPLLIHCGFSANEGTDGQTYRSSLPHPVVCLFGFSFTFLLLVRFECSNMKRCVNNGTAALRSFAVLQRDGSRNTGSDSVAFKSLLWMRKCRLSWTVNTLRTGLLNCLNARSRGLTFRHRASCI